MPKWIEDRAAHIRSKNPNMSESQSWGIATQQAHKLGKTPKGYGTKEGKQMARAKYTRPRKEYLKKAASDNAIMYSAFFDEMGSIHKEASMKEVLDRLLTGTRRVTRRSRMPRNQYLAEKAAQKEFERTGVMSATKFDRAAWARRAEGNRRAAKGLVRRPAFHDARKKPKFRGPVPEQLKRPTSIRMLEAA